MGAGVGGRVKHSSTYLIVGLCYLMGEGLCTGLYTGLHRTAHRGCVS